MIRLNTNKLKFITGNYKTLTPDIQVEDVLYLYTEKNAEILSRNFILKAFTKASEDHMNSLLDSMVKDSYLQDNGENQLEIIYE